MTTSIIHTLSDNGIHLLHESTKVDPHSVRNMRSSKQAKKVTFEDPKLFQRRTGSAKARIGNKDSDPLGKDGGQFEKRYFQTMLSRLQTLRTSKVNYARVKIDKDSSKRPTDTRFASNVLENTYPHTKRRPFNRRSRAVSPSDQLSRSRSLDEAALESEGEGISGTLRRKSPLEIVGVRSVMSNRPSSRPQTPELRSSRSREILHKLQWKASNFGEEIRFSQF